MLKNPTVHVTQKSGDVAEAGEPNGRLTNAWVPLEERGRVPIPPQKKKTDAQWDWPIYLHENHKFRPFM